MACWRFPKRAIGWICWRCATTSSMTMCSTTPPCSPMRNWARCYQLIAPTIAPRSTPPGSTSGSTCCFGLTAAGWPNILPIIWSGSRRFGSNGICFITTLVPSPAAPFTCPGLPFANMVTGVTAWAIYSRSLLVWPTFTAANTLCVTCARSAWLNPTPPKRSTRRSTPVNRTGAITTAVAT